MRGNVLKYAPGVAPPAKSHADYLLRKMAKGMSPYSQEKARRPPRRVRRWAQHETKDEKDSPNSSAPRTGRVMHSDSMTPTKYAKATKITQRDEVSEGNGTEYNQGNRGDEKL